MKSNPQVSWLRELDRAEAYADWVFEQARPHLGRRVLEVGCGRGTYTRRLARSVESVVALDIDQDFASAAHEATRALANVEIRRADINRESFVDEFDTVLMLDVLEHIADDAALLKKLGRALRPGGHLVVKVPAFTWLYGAVDRSVGHRRRYSRGTLSRDLVAAGFAAPTIWHFNAAAIPGWWLNTVLLKREEAPPAQLSAFVRLLPLVKAIDRAARPFVGLSLFAVAARRIEEGAQIAMTRR
jgi:SAM-dependent methyltransferase